MNYLPSFLVSLVLNGIPAFVLVYFGGDLATNLINSIPEPFNQGVIDSWRDYASPWYFNAAELHGKAQIDPLLLPGILPGSLLQVGCHGNYNFRSSDCGCTLLIWQPE